MLLCLCPPQPVTVLRDISDQSVFTNKEAEFQCEITINYPEIALSWYKGTQKLDSSDKYDISASGDRHLLKIRRCQASDQGNYRVVCGPHISSAKLIVMGQWRDRVPITAPVCLQKVAILWKQKYQKNCYLSVTEASFMTASFVMLSPIM